MWSTMLVWSESDSEGGVRDEVDEGGCLGRESPPIQVWYLVQKLLSFLFGWWDIPLSNGHTDKRAELPLERTWVWTGTATMCAGMRTEA
ncbi:hypothetical protein NDU88_002132 [Pleurodeles waltl]|uniref:Uncharacterized protein n=1 Tax=Pleurodeles waltl TaxID=8319 RepID=A0AAV7SC21_PLEWA|nr:hypothetical protein NDU88_002132 [Pleurodeles waltl]